MQCKLNLQQHSQVVKLLRKANYTSSTGTSSSCISAAIFLVLRQVLLVLQQPLLVLFSWPEKAIIAKPYLQFDHIYIGQAK